MKKSRRILLLCGVLLILLCFVGCTNASVTEDETVGTESLGGTMDSEISDLSSRSEEAISSDIDSDSEAPSTDVGNTVSSNTASVYDTFDGSHLADEILYENSMYRIERVDGNCYLTFYRLPEELVSSGCVVHSPNVQFKSADDLFLRFTGKASMALDSYSLQQIRTFFTPDEQGRYRVIDPYNFRVPVIPSWEISYMVMSSDGVYFMLPIPDENEKPANVRFSFVSEESYNREVNRFQAFGSQNTTYVVSHEEERNATVYRTENGSSYWKNYVLQDGEKTLYVSEKYVTTLIDSESEEPAPFFTKVYGTDGVSFFEFYVNVPPSRPTVEWLLSIETAPYVPKQ